MTFRNDYSKILGQSKMTRAISSVGYSNRLITGWSGVRVPDGPPYKYRGIAQLVEQRSPKPRAEGSSPSAPAIKKSENVLFSDFLFSSIYEYNGISECCSFEDSNYIKYKEVYYVSLNTLQNKGIA